MSSEPIDRPPPPVVGAARHPGEVQLWFVMPDGWRLSPAVLPELQQAFRDLAVPGDGGTADWRLDAHGGWVWCQTRVGEEALPPLRDVAQKYMVRDHDPDSDSEVLP